MNVDFQEIIESLEYYYHDKQKVIEVLNEISCGISSNPKILNGKLIQAIEEYAEDNNRCSICGEKLIQINSKECSEYNGFPVEENICEYICSNCGEL